jgi:hypothetical protein
MGAAFATEHELVRCFESVAVERLPKFSRMVEVDSKNGIADVVFFELNSNRKQDLALGYVDPRWAYALRAIQYRKFFTTEQFATWACVSTKTAAQVLWAYVAAGYCEHCPSSNRWIKRKQPRLLAKKIFAVEAKLRDWRRALEQARRYREYAHQSWVLLDKNHIRPALKNTDAFERANVGLAMISVDGEVERLSLPKETAPSSDMARWYVNAKLAQVL